MLNTKHLQDPADLWKRKIRVLYRSYICVLRSATSNSGCNFALTVEFQLEAEVRGGDAAALDDDQPSDANWRHAESFYRHTPPGDSLGETRLTLDDTQTFCKATTVSLKAERYLSLK